MPRDGPLVLHRLPGVLGLAAELLEPAADGGAVIQIGTLVNPAPRRRWINAVGELGGVFVAFYPEKKSAQQQRQEHPVLCEAGLVDPRGLQGEHDRDARADQHKRIESANRLAQVDVVRLGPDWGTEAEHHVTPEQRREEHDLRRQEKPHDELATGEWQAGLVLQRDVAVTVVAMVAMVAMASIASMTVADGGSRGVHDRCSRDRETVRQAFQTRPPQ